MKRRARNKFLSASFEKDAKALTDIKEVEALSIKGSGSVRRVTIAEALSEEVLPELLASMF